MEKETNLFKNARTTDQAKVAGRWFAKAKHDAPNEALGGFSRPHLVGPSAASQILNVNCDGRHNAEVEEINDPLERLLILRGLGLVAKEDGLVVVAHVVQNEREEAGIDISLVKGGGEESTGLGGLRYLIASTRANAPGPGGDGAEVGRVLEREGLLGRLKALATDEELDAIFGVLRDRNVALRWRR